MSRQVQWCETLRRVAEKSNPVLAATLRQLAARHDQAEDAEGLWIGPAREPGEEG